jgi:very-short-patch-repair endonuclease
MASYEKVLLSRQLRGRSTVTEKIAWNMLRNRGMFGHRFKRQVVIHGFVLDFFCNELKLAVEIDGPIAFVRITTKEIEEAPEKLADAIKAHAMKLPKG